MRYRIAGTPSSYLIVDDFLIEDADGGTYLAEPLSGALTPLLPDEAVLVSGVYQPSTDINWRSAEELLQLLAVSTRHEPAQV